MNWVFELVKYLNEVKDPFFKFVIKGVLLLFLVALAFVIGFGIFGLWNGKYLKWDSKDYGIEHSVTDEKTSVIKKSTLAINDSPKRDTVKQARKSIYKDTFFRKAISKKQPDHLNLNKAISGNLPIKNPNIKRKLVIVKPKKLDTNSRSQFNLPNATFNGPTQFGNDNTQNNQFGPTQRVATKQIIDDILSHIPNKDITISVEGRDNQKETLTYISSIVQKLKKKGFEKILTITTDWGGLNDVIYIDDPEATANDKKKFHFNLQDEVLHVCLPNN